MDFLVHTERPCVYDPEVLALGARILRCPPPKPPWRYAKSLWRILRQHGPYDVVHSHVHHYSGWVLSIASLADVPVRISHSHTDTRTIDEQAGTVRGLYLEFMSGLLRRSATAGFACTREAGAALYGSSWQSDPRWSVLPYGIDLGPFRALPSSSLRDELGISRDSFVVGHVGRFAEVKNHSFIVSIAQAAAATGSPLHFLLIGEGPLRENIVRRVAETGLSSRFTFADPRREVAALMISVMDGFVLPSLHEGLPLALVEAQAAGLPCLVADTVSPESKIIDKLFFWESLRSSPQIWAARLIGLRSARAELAREHSLPRLEGSPFDIRSNLQRLQVCYSQQPAR